MATLEELQEQLATLKEKYSEVIEGSYSYEESIATIAVNMQEQLDDAQAAASSAGTYAAIAENAADEAAVAGAEAGATAGASAAQDKYDDIFTQGHTWDASQTFYSLKADHVKSTLVEASTFSASMFNLVNSGGSSGIELETNSYPDHNYMTLTGKNFSNGLPYDNVHLAAYSADFKYLAAENAISIEGVSLDKPELQYLKSLIKPSTLTNYYEDSYFDNLWADKRTDDIYVRRINKFAYNPAPAMAEAWDSVPRTVNLELKDGGTRNYENALHTLFVTADKDAEPYCTPATDVTPGYDPVKDVLVGFWERCNYYKDDNGDVRITAVRGDDDFDKRKADVGTFGPTLWFAIRDGLEKDSDGNVMYTDIIVSTAPHPELGLHPHPLAMRSDGTVAPYWCCSAYPAGTKDYQLVSAYGSNIMLKYKNLDTSYIGPNDAYLTAPAAAEYCRKRGKGYGGGVHINFLVQLMFLLKYGTKDSQSVFMGVSMGAPNVAMSFNVDNNITKTGLSYNLERGAHWIPIAENLDLYSVFCAGHAINIGITGVDADNRGLPDNDTPLPVLNIEPAEAVGTKYYKIFLETEYSIRLQPNDTVSIRSSLAPAGITDRVLMNYDGVSGYSAWTALKEGYKSSGYTPSTTNITFASTIFRDPTYPFRIHGIEYGMHGEMFMDKIGQTADDNVTIGYYRLPWEEKILDENTTHITSEPYDVYGYGADYASLIIKAADDSINEYAVVIGVPVPAVSGSTTTGLCDLYKSPSRSYSFMDAVGWGYSYADGNSGLFCSDYVSMNYSIGDIGMRL